MASAIPPRNVFRKEGENCMRLVKLIQGPGCTALQNVLVKYTTQKYAQPSFDKVLLDPGVKTILQNLVGKGKPLTRTQWFTLYGKHFPQENIHKLGKPETFDITLTFLLVRNLCGIAPPKVPAGSPPGTKPSWDTEPISADRSLEANLARIKFYRNHLCHHETGEIPDHEFNDIFDTLKKAIKEISATLNLPPPEWSVTPADLERFRIDPIGQEDAEELENMRKDWRRQERDVSDELAEIKDVQKQQVTQLKKLEKQQKSTIDCQQQQHLLHTEQLKDIKKEVKATNRAIVRQEKTVENMGQNVQEILKCVAYQKAQESTTGKEEISGISQLDMENLQIELSTYYSLHLSHVQRLPTDKDDTMLLKDVFVNVAVSQIVLKNNSKEILPLEHYSQVFAIAERGSHILLEGGSGVGKTVLVKRVTLDWIEAIENMQQNVVRELQGFDLVFVVTLGHVKEGQSLSSIIKDQHNLKIEKEKLEQILESNDRILLVLDGYDEYMRGACPQIDAIIERRNFTNLTVLMTSRSWKSNPFSTTQRLFQYHFQIEGFRTIEDIIEYVQRYFQDPSKAESFVTCIAKYKLFELSKVPIILLILCLLFEEEGQSLPSDQHVLYWKLMNWFYMRYLGKGGKCDMPLKETILKLGKVALQGLLKGQLLFKRDEVEKELGTEVFKIGFLSSEKIRGFTAANISVSFSHKSIQDYVAGYFLANPDGGLELMRNTSQFRSLHQFLILEKAFEFAVKISGRFIPHILSMYDPLRDKELFEHFSKRLRNVDYICEMPLSHSLKFTAYSVMQTRFSSGRTVINKREFDPTDAVSSPLPQALTCDTLTTTDIVGESEKVLACIPVSQYARYPLPENSCFLVMTKSMVTAVVFNCEDIIEENMNFETLLRCLVKSDLECLSVLELPNRNYLFPEVWEICHKSKALEVLDFSNCEIGKEMTPKLCDLVARHPNLRDINLSYNENLEWELFFPVLLSSGKSNLSILRLRNCSIPESVVVILADFIRSQRDLVSLDLSMNDDLEEEMSLIVQMLPETASSTFNLVSLGLGPVSPSLSNALKSVISRSPNLRELTLLDCHCDVSKEITETQNLEILDISGNCAWIVPADRAVERPLDVGYILRHLDKLQKLREIWAVGCCIGDDIIDHLTLNLHKNPKLARIYFLANPISEEKWNIFRDTYLSVDIHWEKDVFDTYFQNIFLN